MHHDGKSRMTRRALIAAAAVSATAMTASILAKAAPIQSLDETSRDSKTSRIFITGSSSGLGLLAGQALAEQGHRVVLHARNAARAEGTKIALPACEAVVIGDVAIIAGMRTVAEQVNVLGRFDAVIHNVGIGDREPRRVETDDGLSQLFAINVVTPYLLTALITRPDRLIYLSSSMHNGGDPSLEDLQWQKRRWNGSQAYSDSKLHDTILAMAVARRWPNVLSNTVEPGWVPTRMGGAQAPDDLASGALTQAWLAVSDDAAVRVTGQNFYHQKPESMHPAARRQDVQDRLMGYLAGITGVAMA
jgi:NAD(P)-dependent dehydrogenase (short-subunit alcohol dehydrogenase family)